MFGRVDETTIVRSLSVAIQTSCVSSPIVVNHKILHLFVSVGFHFIFAEIGTEQIVERIRGSISLTWSPRKNLFRASRNGLGYGSKTSSAL
jgi:hypothetical protein